MSSKRGYFIQGWAFTSVRSPIGMAGYESGDGWSAASEGVLAALRLSKSAQSADKVRFSDSIELPFGSSENRGVVTVVGDHDRSLPGGNNQLSARFITDPRIARPEIVFIRPKIAEQEPTQLISLPASVALPMEEIFARDADGAVATQRGASSAA